MKKMCGIVLLLISPLLACASVSEQSRMDRFNDISRSFRWSMLDNDFRAAAGFVDLEATAGRIDVSAYKDIKIVDYKITHSEISKDKRRIEQDVELQYYLVNRNIVKTTQSRMVWQYDPHAKTWRLKTRLPRFDR